MANEATTTAPGVSPGENILGTRPIPELLVKFAVPSVISMMVNSIYNLVDQIFIGQGVGYLGNAATSVIFPFVMISLAVSTMVAVGTAANVGLSLGRGQQDKANRILGNGFSLALIFGTAILIIGQVFLVPLLRLFGATDNILPYAISYGRIFLVGNLFISPGILLSDIIRSDGNPAYAMRSMLLGAIINTVLDPLFIFTFQGGVQGAALATILGQLASLAYGLRYLKKLKTLQFERQNMRLDGWAVKTILTLGLSSFFTQVAGVIMHIIMNQQTIKYGEMSIYGADIPLTVFGIVSKVNSLMMSVVMGISIGSQPIFSFNYGARKFERVKQLVKTALIFCLTIGFIGTLCFQTFPGPIISIFGQAEPLYNEFAVMCLKNMTFFIFVMGVQMVAGVYFQAVGKPVSALVLSLSRQVLFMIPCLLILPVFFGIKGVMWSFPVSDIFSVTLGAIMLTIEMKKMNQMIREQKLA